MKHCGPPVDSPVKIRLEFFFEGGAGKGDADNYFKAAADALQGILYENDKQIVEAHIYKLRAAEGHDPETRITLWRGLVESESARQG